tara:strand:- start:260 stop:844 length:585 start_codon:yes stop_codon:yes gene_type:complete
MSILHWLIRGRRKPKSLIYVHHNTGEHANKACDLVKSTAWNLNIPVWGTTIDKYKDGSGSREEYWRDQRYFWFNEVQARDPLPIILGHNLDDCLEQYISNKLIRPRKAFTISYRGQANTIRPFRIWRKSSIVNYARRWDIQYAEDPSNSNVEFTRNKIRHEIVPKILEMNPGLYRFVSDRIIEEAKEDKNNLVL